VSKRLAASLSRSQSTRESRESIGRMRTFLSFFFVSGRSSVVSRLDAKLVYDMASDLAGSSVFPTAKTIV